MRDRIEPITPAKKAAIHAALCPGVTVVPSADSLPAFGTTPGAVPPSGEWDSEKYRQPEDPAAGSPLGEFHAAATDVIAQARKSDVVYVGEAPVGAKLMAFGDKVFMVATGMAPHWVTPTGLVLMQRADGSE